MKTSGLKPEPSRNFFDKRLERAVVRREVGREGTW
jgi:hypothetical protein